MPTTRSNLAQTPVNSDTLNWTGDLATMADSLLVIVPCADTAAGDTVATARAAAGFAVSDSRPLFIWDLSQDCIMIKDSSGWRGAGAMVRHQEVQSNGFVASGGYVNWDIGTLTNYAPVQVGTSFLTMGPLSGQITFNETGWYSVTTYSVPTAGTAGNCAVFMNKNNGGQILAANSSAGYPAWEPGSMALPRAYFVAGDTIRFTLVVQNGSTWSSRVYVDKLGN